ncbi:TIGR03905 family TSCPD domain-containing protein [bacterium]|nr:TIGR03905 family TSCPD domain-containing protein [bacterium]
MSNIEIQEVNGVDEVRYVPQGVCSKLFIIKIKDDVILSLEAVGGCSGNLKGIGSLVKGMNIQEVASKISGIPCGSRPTSCPDQISKAIEAYVSEKQKSHANV